MTEVNLSQLASLTTVNASFLFPPVPSVLVDFHGRPYNEGERLEHNKRVEAGAHYAELLTVDDMLKRYRLLHNPRRVFDLESGHTYAPGAFHSAYAASNVRVGRKRVPVTQLFMQQAAGLGGVFFHTVNAAGEIERQGQVLADKRKNKRSVYLVQLFNWLVGDEGGDPFEVDARSTKGWRWYGSAEEMRSAYEALGK